MPLLDDDVTLSSTTGGAKSIAHAGQASQPAQAQTQSQSSLARVALGKGTTPAVASARLSAKTLKEFTSVKSLIEKAVDEATKLLSKMSDYYDSEAAKKDDLSYKEIQKRYDIVVEIRDGDATHSSAGDAELLEAVEADEYLRELSFVQLNVMNVRSLTYLRSVMAPCQPTNEGALAVFERQIEVLRFMRLCAESLFPGQDSILYIFRV